MTAPESNYQRLRCGIYECVHFLSNYKSKLFKEIIYADEDGHKPLTPYLTIRLSPRTRIGRPMHNVLNNGNIMTVIRYEITVDLRSYGNCAVDAMWELESRFNQKWLIDECTQEWCRQGLSLAITETQTVQDLSTILESTHEKRALMTLVLNYSECIEEDGDDPQGLAIRKLSVNQKLTGKNGEIKKKTKIIDS